MNEMRCVQSSRLHRLVASFTIFIGTTIGAKSQDSPREIEVLWQAALKANPNIKQSETFYRRYAAQVLPYMHDFDGFVAVLQGEEAYACRTSLLCRDDAKLVPAFRASSEPTAIDFIKYVRTSTCYGYLPSVENQTRFLQDLEKSLPRTTTELNFLFPKETSAREQVNFFIINELANAKNKSGVLLLRVGDRKYPSLSNLLRESGVGRGTHRPTPPLPELARLRIANEICARAYGNAPAFK